MTMIAADRAKNDFDELLRRVAEGEEILITTNGKPVVKLVRVEESPEPEVQPARGRAMTLEELREFRKDLVLGDDITIKQLIEEGRRF